MQKVAFGKVDKATQIMKTILYKNALQNIKY